MAGAGWVLVASIFAGRSICGPVRSVWEGLFCAPLRAVGGWPTVVCCVVPWSPFRSPVHESCGGALSLALRANPVTEKKRESAKERKRKGSALAQEGVRDSAGVVLHAVWTGLPGNTPVSSIFIETGQFRAISSYKDILLDASSPPGSELCDSASRMLSYSSPGIQFSRPQSNMKVEPTCLPSRTLQVSCSVPGKTGMRSSVCSCPPDLGASATSLLNRSLSLREVEPSEDAPASFVSTFVSKKLLLTMVRLDELS